MRAYRERKAAGEPSVRYRKPKDRRTRQRRWRDTVFDIQAACQVCGAIRNAADVTRVATAVVPAGANSRTSYEQSGCRCRPGLGRVRLPWARPISVSSNRRMTACPQPAQRFACPEYLSISP
jgi:hypothetical protein